MNQIKPTAWKFSERDFPAQELLSTKSNKCEICQKKLTAQDKKTNNYIIHLVGNYDKTSPRARTSSFFLQVEGICHRECWDKPVKQYSDWKGYKQLVKHLY